MEITIRNETESDYRKVEKLTREAFWNLYIEGCDEHYLVHIMRKHKDFITNLAFVAVVDGRIVGNIMYTKSYIIDEHQNKIDTITFGPISVLPEYQRMGIGTALINHSKTIAKENNHKIIVIQGHPHNYCKHGFKSSKDFDISDEEGRYPYGLLVFEIEKGALNGVKGRYYLSDVYNVDSNAAEQFDSQFEYKKKEYKYTQYEFLLACKAYL